MSYRTCVQGVTADEIDVAASEIEIVHVEWDVEQHEVDDDEEGQGKGEGKGVGRPHPPAEPPRYGKNQGKSKGPSFDAYVQRVVREATAAANFANAAAASTAIEPIGSRRVSQRISGSFGGESHHDVIPIRRDTLRDICESIDDAVRATEQARRILESGSAAFEEQQRRLKSSLISLRRALEDGRQA